MAKPAKPKKETRKKAQKAVKAAAKGGRKAAKPKARGKRGKHGKKDAADPPAPKNAPKGRRLTNAEKTVRDTLIVERVALGWNWPDIAKEAGLSQEQTKRNYRARMKALPKLLEMDPMKIIELLVEGFQSSVIDFEVMAREYAERNPSAAVGAKKAAVETRKDLAQLLQATGQLPHELGTLRHLHDIRMTVRHLLGHVDKFSERVRTIELPPAQKEEVLEAADELKGGLREIAGDEEQAAEPAAA
jgi:hypothetical protein